MVDLINTDNSLYQTGSRMGQVSSESYELKDSAHLKAKITKSRGKLTQNNYESQPAEETKAQTSNKTNSKCPAQSTKPKEVKPKELSDKQKLEAAKKEKETLFKELEKSNLNPMEAVKKLTQLKETFSTLDTAFRIKIADNQKANDSHKPSHHTDINGNNTKAQDAAFYAKNNASTNEYIGLRSQVKTEISSINNKVLQEEMRFLRS